MSLKGKNDNLEWGTWNVLCDRCGFKFKAYDVKEEWQGLLVCKKCYERRHPQDFLRGVPDDPSVPWARPDIEANDSVETVGDENKTLTVGTHASTQIWDTPFSRNRKATLDDTGAVEGDEFTIHRTASDEYTLQIGSPVVLKYAVGTSSTVVRFNGTAWELISYITTGL